MDDDGPYVLPPELRQAIREAESGLRRSVQAVEGGFLIYRETPIFAFRSDAGDVVLNGSDLLRFLEPLVLGSAYDSARGAGSPKPGISFGTAAGRKIQEFIEQYFYELRNLICKNPRSNFPLSPQTSVAIAALAHWLMEHFGIANEYAKYMAATLLVTLLSATKGTFCKMTAKEAKAAIARYTR